MINYIEAELYKNKSLSITSSAVIEGENLSNTLKIKIANEYINESNDYFIEFQLENNKRYTSETLSVVNGFVNYPMPSVLFTQIGTLYIQVIIKSYVSDDVITVKSTVNGQMYVSRSISAAEHIIMAKSIVDEFLQTVADLKQLVSDNVQATDLLINEKFEQTDLLINEKFEQTDLLINEKFEAVDSIVGDISALLDELNGEVVE